MVISSALLLLLSAYGLSDSYEEYSRLSNQLSDRIEWIDNNGSINLTKEAAKRKLSALSRISNVQDISKKHFSTWKNGKCYWIFDLPAQEKAHRIYFFCKRDRSGVSRVTKIKVS